MTRSFFPVPQGPVGTPTLSTPLGGLSTSRAPSLSLVLSTPELSPAYHRAFAQPALSAGRTPAPLLAAFSPALVYLGSP